MVISELILPVLSTRTSPNPNKLRIDSALSPSPCCAKMWVVFKGSPQGLETKILVYPDFSNVLIGGVTENDYCDRLLWYPE